MTDWRSLRHFLWLALLVALSGTFAGCLGCQQAPEPTADALRMAFAEQSARVLDGDVAFVATDDGFAVTAPERALRAALPKAGADAVHFEVEGLAIDVVEDGSLEAGEIAGSAVAYRRAGGTSYWSANEDGYEEWLHLDEGIATGRAPVATWTVTGAAVREADGAIEIAGADGAARIRVTAPEAWAAGGRAVPANLRANGSTIELWVDAGGAAVLVDPAWTAAGNLAAARGTHVQVVLQNGKVLVAGGYTGAAVIKSAELYDPAANTWTSAGNMAAFRESHRATLLANGKVLVTGGDDGALTLASTELYDPVANTWAAAAPMLHPRTQHTATLLQNGKVLVVGGFDDVAETKLVEIYDPALNTWTNVAQALVVRYGHTATLLNNGKVVIAGGGDFLTYYASAEIYDPAANTWVAAGTLTGGARDSHSAVLLGNGKILVAGGVGAGVLATASLYDPATNAWTAAASMTGARQSHGAALLASGQVLHIGGYNAAALSTVQQYDPVANTWTAGPAMIGTRYAFGTSVLPSGVVLVSGGFSGAAAVATAERYSSGSSAVGAACGNAAACLSGFCVDGVCCNTACNAGACDACSVAAGAAVNGTCALLTGPVCNDNNNCTQTDTCQAGVCTGGNPVTCMALDQCHLAGTCNPATGVCFDPIKANGTPCSDGNGCTQTDTCQAGTCTAGTPVTCMAQDQCHVAGACNPANGTCSNPNKADDSPCTDGNSCTQMDTCQAGACTGANPVVCAAQDQCHDAGICNPANGTCSNPNKMDGTGCDDGNSCTQTDACQTGACLGASPVVCAPFDQCHDTGACDPATGMCSNPNKMDGAGCDDGDACTQTDTCQSGACAGAMPVECVALDQCHDVGTCDSDTGVCSDPVKVEGTACDDGDACTLTDTCSAGACAGTTMKCTASDECHDDGACDAATGVCTDPTKADGTPCAGGTCMGGACVPDGTGGAGGSTMTGGSGGAGTGGSGGTGATGTGATDTGGTGAGATDTGGTGGSPTTDAGCGCTTAGSTNSNTGLWIALGLLVVTARRRKRAA